MRSHSGDESERSGLGSTVVGALVLLAVAFLTHQVAPEEEAPGEPDGRKNRRDASPVEVALEQRDRGRLAETPSEIPARG
jgi:membrane protein